MAVSIESAQDEGKMPQYFLSNFVEGSKMESAISRNDGRIASN
jgi:hypothetical protein